MYKIHESSNVIGAKIHSTLDMVFVNCKHIFLGIYSTKVILVSVNEGQSHCCAVVYLSPAVWTFPHSTGIKRLHPALLGFQNLAFIISLHNLHPFAVLLNFNNNNIVPIWHQRKIRSSFCSLLSLTHGSSGKEKTTEGKDSKQQLQNKWSYMILLSVRGTDTCLGVWFVNALGTRTWVTVIWVQCKSWKRKWAYTRKIHRKEHDINMYKQNCYTILIQFTLYSKQLSTL